MCFAVIGRTWATEGQTHVMEIHNSCAGWGFIWGADNIQRTVMLLDLAEKQPPNCQLVSKLDSRGKQTSFHFAINLKVFFPWQNKWIKLSVPYFIHFTALLTVNTDKLRSSSFEFASLNIEWTGVCWPFVHLKPTVQRKHKAWRLVWTRVCEVVAVEARKSGWWFCSFCSFAYWFRAG